MSTTEKTTHDYSKSILNSKVEKAEEDIKRLKTFHLDREKALKSQLAQRDSEIAELRGMVHWARRCRRVKDEAQVELALAALTGTNESLKDIAKSLRKQVKLANKKKSKK